MPVDEVSIGDYVLAGGEVAVLVIVEATCRLLPGVLGNAESVADDSFGGCGVPASSLSPAPAPTLAPAPPTAPARPPAPATGPAAHAAGCGMAAGCGCEAAAGPEAVAGCKAAPGGMAGLLEGPVYTKPRVWRGRDVPAVLLSGNHAAIARWRRDAALRRTAAMRPELIGMLDPAALDDRDREVLSEAGFPVRSEDVAH